MNNFIRIILFIAIVTAIYQLAAAVVVFQFPSASSQMFCEDNGYDTITYEGKYVPYRNKEYGRVICLAFYADGNVAKHIDVEMNWRGKLKKHDALVSERVENE